MPFTLCHPAAVIFSKSNKLNLGALILGSMAPDFIYFLMFSPSSNLGHTFLGFIILNLPICFVLNFLFYKYIQEPFILSLPNFINRHYLYLINKKNKIKNKKDFIVFSYSCILGMFTHVFWDAFTHSTGFFTKHIPLLTCQIILLDNSVPVYKLFQHGSSLLGSLIILTFLYKIRDKNPKSYNITINKINFLLPVILIDLLVLALRYIVSIKTIGYFGIGSFVVTFINGLFLGFLFIGFVYSNRKYNKKT